MDMALDRKFCTALGAERVFGITLFRTKLRKMIYHRAHRDYREIFLDLPSVISVSSVVDFH
jgi:hypothetical protein